MAKYVDAGNADLEAEDYRAPTGVRVTEKVADAAVEKALRSGRAGRPSLSRPGKVSPTVNARVSVATKRELQRLAKERGVKESVLVREAVEAVVSGRRRR
ncbi:hypothetical protein [Flexivirga meconopsidis]|uniref:hypothetical protein n=1 Tax=Flexivirga meconopsidis TaxID=2977121 RepID=UPI00223F2E2F|nr:hypothetical protein [Flexivirga meconopsidis]